MSTSPALESLVLRALGDGHVPGCSLAVVDRSGLRWSGAFGLADLRTRRASAEDDVYHLFSGTKLFTATAILQLAERGALRLEDPVRRFLPELAGAGAIPLEALLSHRSGLKEGLRGLLAVTLPHEAAATTAEALARYPIRAARPPGQRVEYRNVNYAILGEIVARASGTPFRAYVTEHVLRPLGMEAAFGFTDALRARAATGYLGRWDPMRLALRLLFPRLPGQLYRERLDGLIALGEYELATAAIGGLVGAMPEFAKFLVAQLGDGGPILGEGWLRRMQTQVAEGAAGIESRVGVALGWKIGRAGGHRFLNHEGGGAGFTTELRLYPDAGLGIALGMNMMRMPDTMRVAHRICGAVLAGAEHLLPRAPGPS